jgi:hypothetical protein
MERAGISREVAKKISGHKTDSAYRRYNIVDVRDNEDAGRSPRSFWKGRMYEDRTTRYRGRGHRADHEGAG